VVAASVSGALAHWRRRNIDVKMGLVLLAGGVVGSTLGVWFFKFLREVGQVDFVIAICYVLFLGIIGALMVAESVRAWVRARNPVAPRGKLHQHTWMHGLPLKMRFRRSKLYISALLPLAVGVVVGILAAIMGVGGGFIMVPAMIYLIGMPTNIAVGTSLLQTTVVTSNVTFLQALTVQSVDVFLTMFLLVSGVIGAQFGAVAENLAEPLADLSGVRCPALKRAGDAIGFELAVQPGRQFFVGMAIADESSIAALCGHSLFPPEDRPNRTSCTWQMHRPTHGREDRTRF